MSCEDCLEKDAGRRAAKRAVKSAADRHGYTVWFREHEVDLHVLLVPGDHAVGTREEVLDAIKADAVPLNVAPSKARQMMQRDRRSVKPFKDGKGFRLGGGVPLHVTFMDPK